MCVGWDKIKDQLSPAKTKLSNHQTQNHLRESPKFMYILSKISPKCRKLRVIPSHRKFLDPPLHAECQLLLPDYANLILPLLVDTIFVTQNLRFKFPPKSAPKPKMNVDEQTDEQIFADIIRTCSLQLTVEEVNIYDKMLGKPVVFPASIRQDTYRVPKTLLDSAIKDLSLSETD